MIGRFLFRSGRVIGCVEAEGREARIRLCRAAALPSREGGVAVPWQRRGRRPGSICCSRARLLGRLCVAPSQAPALLSLREPEPAAGEWEGGRGPGSGLLQPVAGRLPGPAVRPDLSARGGLVCAGLGGWGRRAKEQAACPDLL